ncbi:MAG: hypothetical protein ACLU0O_00785 [Collinsella sp.]
MANNHTAGAAARTFAPSELCQRMLAKTSKGTCGPCILYLEDGTIFMDVHAAPRAPRPAKSASTPRSRATLRS